MKNHQKGFISHFLLLVVAILIITGVGYYLNLKFNFFHTDLQPAAVLTSDAVTQNRNVGTITIRAIVANIDEVGNKYGSYGMKFAPSKLAEVDKALQRLNTFVKQSSYGKTQLQWKTSGVYELGKGVCDKVSYGDKVNELILRALKAENAKSPLVDYSYYFIVHPMPNCPDGVQWSFEGRGQFVAYNLNGRTVHLRGINISDLSDQYVFHEFGHSLAYKPNTGIGHPDYLSCPITTVNKITKISVSNTCKHIFDFNTGAIPIYTVMSTPSILSDYSAPEKEIAGWLKVTDIVATTTGKYSLSPLEQISSSPKVLKIQVAGTDYMLYISYRQPIEVSKPKGVIMDIVRSSSSESFLTTNTGDNNAPLKIGVPYQINNGPIITVTAISNNRASITLSHK